FAALYLIRGDSLERVAGPSNLPPFLPLLPALHQHLDSHKGLVRLEDLEPLAARSPILANLLDALSAADVRMVGDLASPRRRVGLVLLSGKIGQLSLEKGELDLLDSLLNQAAIALETSLLLEERTEQAELERELEIAASVQARLLPRALSFGPGWQVEAICHPARHVGGDFFTELPGPHHDSSAIVYGDVAGKSVSGAMVMMAAHEALHSLAMTHRDPETLFALANERLYDLSEKSFVALAYLTSAADGKGLDYMLAGQPQPLLRSRSGEVTELPLPEHRLPLGALKEGFYRLSHTPMGSGDLILGYSDGVIDAVSPAGEIFGTDRLARVVREAPASPSAVVQQVVSALEEFTHGSEPYDDVTLVAVGCDGKVVT
ncbi:MAG: SpoIIE family protein phosphatase, partial [Thermoanaerobaculia bacterium]